MSEITESRFLHEQYPQLNDSPEVGHVLDFLQSQGEDIPSSKAAARVNAYLGFLANEDYVNDGFLTGDQASVDRQIEAAVIKPEDVPESFFRTQQRAARQLGHGNVKINDAFREKATTVVRTDQRNSLRKWVEYLNDEESKYPAWFKYYALNSVIKLVDYDKERDKFPKRERNTTDPFPHLNTEALAQVYDALLQVRIEPEKHQDSVVPAQLKGLVKDGSFQRLYTHMLKHTGFTDPELLKETRGSWTEYEQSDNPADVRRLSTSLQGYGTGWCTAGEATAEAQLSAGDFYVFYTKDKAGNDRVPRIAIRLEDDQVVEVRGILGGGVGVGVGENTRQELEPDMIDIAMEKLQSLPGGERYLKKAADMKWMTELERKVAAESNVGLTTEELRFLYEVGGTIEGFGFYKDPRIAELKGLRDPAKDLAQIFDVTADKVVSSQSDINNGSVVFIGELNLEKLPAYSFKDLPDLQWIEGDISFGDIPFATLSNETAKRLAEVGQAQVVMDNLNRFESLHAGSANALIDAGRAGVLAKNLEHCITLGAGVAHRMVDAGYAQEVARNLVSFGASVDRQELAIHIIDTNQVKALGENLGQFKGLDSKVAEKLIDAGYGPKVSFFLDRFREVVDHNALVDRIIEAGYVRGIDLRHMSGLDNATAHKFIELGNLDVVRNNLRSFGGLSNDVAEQLITDGRLRDVIHGLDKFPNVNHDYLASLCLEYEPMYFRNKLAYFRGLGNEIAARLLQEGHFSSVGHNLHSFEGLSADVANILIDHGRAEEVGDYIDRFVDLPESVLERLSREGARIQSYLIRRS